MKIGAEVGYNLILGHGRGKLKGWSDYYPEKWCWANSSSISNTFMILAWYHVLRCRKRFVWICSWIGKWDRMFQLMFSPRWQKPFKLSEIGRRWGGRVEGIDWDILGMSWLRHLPMPKTAHWTYHLKHWTNPAHWTYHAQHCTYTAHFFSSNTAHCPFC